MRPLLLILLLSCLRVSYAQVKMYGTTAAGGANGFGVLFSINSDGSSYQVLHSFAGGADGANPYASVVMGTDSKLYGTARNGGSSGNGAIFSYDTLTHTYAKAADFTGANGAHPDGDLIFFNNKLYGLAPFGGASGKGTIFSYDLSAGTLADAFDLTTGTGTHPHGNLTVYHGRLYFVNSLGGTGGNGTIANFDPATGICTVLYNFPANLSGNGSPHSGLVVIDSLMYGSVVSGDNAGNLYSFDPASGTYTDIYDLNSYSDGAFPNNLRVKDGILYGTAQQGLVTRDGPGGGTIFSFDPAAKSFWNRWPFVNVNRPTDMAEPVSPPVPLPDGTWIGTDLSGGQIAGGTIYKWDITNGSAYKIFEFTGANGEQPRGTLYIPDSITHSTTPQTITFANISKTYGDPDFDGGAVASSGLPVTYSSSDTNVAVINDSNKIHITGAGTALITAYQPGNSTYAPATPVTDTLTVNKASLTITANSFTIPYRTPIPPLTVTYSGFVYGQDSSVLLVQPTVTSTAPSPTPEAGTYSIEAAGAVASNYLITYVPGALVVEPPSDRLTVWMSGPGTLTVVIQSDDAQRAELTVFSRQGQKVVRTMLSLQKGFNYFDIAVGDLRPGIYFVRVAGRKLNLTKTIRIN